jgi:alpha-1,3-rhamnosyltransferase
LIDNPLISIIIPSYNHEKYVGVAIESIYTQTYKNFELIVIDDGSSDNSHNILINLQKKYHFTYIHRKNKGLIKTLNEALELSKGEYFTMLGSDDYYKNNKLELQINFFKKNPDYVLCYGNITFIDSNGEILKNGKIKKFKSGKIFNDLLYENFIPLPTIMLKTSIIKEFKFDEKFFLEDYPLLLKIAKKYKIGFLENSLTFYRLHENNVSSNIIKMITEVENILAIYKTEIGYKKAISKWYLRWFTDLAKTNYKDFTYKYMIKSLPSSFYKPKFLKAVFRYFLT